MNLNAITIKTISLIIQMHLISSSSSIPKSIIMLQTLHKNEEDGRT
jgi:hypothetical protein